MTAGHEVAGRLPRTIPAACVVHWFRVVWTSCRYY